MNMRIGTYIQTHWCIGMVGEPDAIDLSSDERQRAGCCEDEEYFFRVLLPLPQQAYEQTRQRYDHQRYVHHHGDPGDAIGPQRHVLVGEETRPCECRSVELRRRQNIARGVPPIRSEVANEDGVKAGAQPPNASQAGS